MTGWLGVIGLLLALVQYLLPYDPHAARDRLIREGEAALQEQRWTVAADRFSQALEEDDSSPRALLGAGMAAHRLSRFDEARGHYGRCTELDGANARCAINYGVSFIDEAVGRKPDARAPFYALALQQFRRVRPQFPEDARLSHQLVVVHLLRRENETALAEAQRSARADDLDPPLNIYLPYNASVAALRVLAEKPEPRSGLCAEASAFLGEAARRTSKYPHFRPTFQQLLRELENESWQSLCCDPGEFAQLLDRIGGLGFQPPASVSPQHCTPPAPLPPAAVPATASAVGA
ncbi:MAG: hypothetical protein MJE66_02030 [Proteobacteria bacterium]|nr:hypothetical protein [Pseudomonadota bacterium]